MTFSDLAAPDELRLMLRPPVRTPEIIRDLQGLPAVLAWAGPLELRLATTRKEIRKAQRLRYKVFYEEGGATPSPEQARGRRDVCPCDAIADHLLVIDSLYPARWGGTRRKVVGTYRLIRGDMSAGGGPAFYSASEFAIAPLLARHPEKRFLELGRSCVHADYRNKRVIDLLWRGIGSYAAHHGINVLIGCASLPGTDPDRLAAPLGFAFHHAAAPPDWQVEPVAGRAIRMDRLPKDAIDARRTMASLPPLVKAYVRAGSLFASQAVVDDQFGTTDLFTMLQLNSAEPRYLAHFGTGLAAERAC